MWNILNGTIVNAVTVAAGASAGLALSSRLPERLQKNVLTCLGLVTITLGIDAAVLGMGEAVRRFGPDVPGYGARLAMVNVGSLLIGVIIGTLLRIHDRIEGLGRAIHGRFSARRPAGAPAAVPSAESAGRFAEGFLSASVIFCVGPLTLLGCLQNGAQENPSLLYIKSLLDCFCAMALAASLGAGVLCSVATVLIFQGGLALAATAAAGALPELSLHLMNTVGGVVLLATALMILDLKRVPVADLLPGIFLPPAVVWLVERISPGLLILRS